MSRGNAFARRPMVRARLAARAGVAASRARRSRFAASSRRAIRRSASTLSNSGCTVVLVVRMLSPLNMRHSFKISTHREDLRFFIFNSAVRVLTWRCAGRASRRARVIARRRATRDARATLSRGETRRSEKLASRDARARERGGTARRTRAKTSIAHRAIAERGSRRRARVFGSRRATGGARGVLRGRSR